MTSKRRIELDELIVEYTKEFRDNATTEGRFGALYLSCDANNDIVQISLECAREPFIRMILSLMEASEAIAEDITKAVEQYEPRDPLNLKLITG